MDKIEKNNFILYKEWKELFDDLTNEQAGKLIKAIFSYTKDRTETKLDASTSMLFKVIRNQLERDLDKYKNKVKKNRENGAKGGSSKGKRTLANATESNQTLANLADKDKDKDKEEDKDIYINMFEFYNSLGIIEHKQMNEEMKKGIDKAISTLRLDQDHMKRMLQRYSDSYKESLKTEYPKKKRTLAQFFGQKKYQSVELICSDYHDDVWETVKQNTKTKSKQEIAEEQRRKRELFESLGD